MKIVSISGFALLLISLAAILPAQTRERQVDHGSYIVQNVAMCLECHTPRNARGELDRAKLFQGAPIPVRAPFRDQQWAFQAPKIAGLPGWTEGEAARLLEIGRRTSGVSPRAPMPGYRMTRNDAEAVVSYLKSLR